MTERGRADGRAETWVEERATRGRVLPAWPGLAEFLEPARGCLIRWLAADVAPGRLVPWLPVAFGAGIVLYFTADHEPVTLAPVTLALLLATAAMIARARPVRFALLVGLTAVACGFSAATIKTRLIAHPVLHRTVPSAAVTGWVESHEERERTDRMIVRVDHIDAPRLEEALERVRVSVRKGAAPSVGAFVSFKARLNPPLAPLRPGSYDFARDLYFQNIGATGFVSGGIRVIAAPRPAAIRVSYLALIESLRETIDRRIRAVVPGDAGSIASALITGKQDAISTPVNDALYVSSLAHVLSISGYHLIVLCNGAQGSAGQPIFCGKPTNST